MDIPGSTVPITATTGAADMMADRKSFVNEAREAKLIAWLTSEIEKAMQAKEPMFLGVPDTWYETGLHLCNSGHINSMYLKSDYLGCCVCLECSQPSHLCPPGISEEQLKQILNA